MDITAIVLTKNEEANLTQCLERLTFCDEIIVVDDFSTDRSLQTAKNFGVKVYQRKLNDDFAAQRNFGLAKAKSDWVLFIDADERVSPVLRDEIVQKTKEAQVSTRGFYLKRNDILWGKTLQHGETGNAKFVRLARLDAGKWSRPVHETWQVKGKPATLKNPLLHFPHQSLREFLDDINYFSTLHARANLKEGKAANLAKMMFWPKLKFIQNYFLKLGFLDGTQGFVMALLMSLHSFLSWGKLWKMTTK